jgi:hypothetical protein
MTPYSGSGTIIVASPATDLANSIVDKDSLEKNEENIK